SYTAEDYRIYGAHQLLHYPEIADPMIFEFLLEAIDKHSLPRYLPTPLRTGKPSILIGGELGQAIFKNMSLVSIAYNGKGCSGEIHILGPTRMAYEKVIGLAEFTANQMKTLINTKYSK
ncbi:MAG: hypothetical protein L3J79_05810, partial [Candidatus Marinimicrobia bacterium]|nr:hypothetical protein [Candidatus Neomarinimicrobiota bacterium]